LPCRLSYSYHCKDKYSSTSTYFQVNVYSFLKKTHQHHYQIPNNLKQPNMATTVYVKNIALGTEDKEIREFFSFW